MQRFYAFSRKFSTVFKQDSSSLSDLLLWRNRVSLSNALSFSVTSNSLALGTQIHGHVFKLGFSNDIFSQNNLMRMYFKCGGLTDGLKVFDEMLNRNLVSWTLVISGTVQNSEFELSLEMYSDMRRSGFMPNQFALGSVMKACTATGAYDFGSCVHGLSLKTGIEKNPFVGCSVLSMYAELDDIQAAEKVFESVENPDVGCHNALITGYANCGYGFEAIKIFSLMHCEKLSMDTCTYISAIKVCLIICDFDLGKQIHGLIFRSKVGFSTSIMNALMDMYFKSGGKNYALKLFTQIQNKDNISWNTMFAGLSAEGDATEVTSLVRESVLIGLNPNHVTFSILFRLCGNLLDLDLGLHYFGLAVKSGVTCHVNVLRSLINMFARCGAMRMAYVVLDNVISRNIILLNEMICGCTLRGSYLEALKGFRDLWVWGVKADECTYSCSLEACCKYTDCQMARQIHGAIIKSGYASNGYVNTSLIKSYVTVGLLESSSQLLDDLEELDLAVWGATITALVRQGFHYEAQKLFHSLISAGERPDVFILGSILNSSASIGGYQQTKSVHMLCLKMGLNTHAIVASAIIDAYAKCGDIESARETFHQSLRSNDVILYNTMIMAYAHHGLVMEAMEAYENMKVADLRPSQATFVSIMSACSHMGLVDQGLLLFESINSVYKMEPSSDIYGCLVDMLSRNGYLEDARSIIESMPFTPWPPILRSLLSGCKIHGNREVGKWAAEKLIKLVPESDAAAYVLLSEVYSEGGSWQAAAEARLTMVQKGVSKDIGYTRIEI